jgi:hypothetical protein
MKFGQDVTCTMLLTTASTSVVLTFSPLHLKSGNGFASGNQFKLFKKIFLPDFFVDFDLNAAYFTTIMGQNANFFAKMVNIAEKNYRNIELRWEVFKPGYLVFYLGVKYQSN